MPRKPSIVLLSHENGAVASKAAARVKNWLARLLKAITEARMRRVQLEIELYRGRYRHSSKMDDDLPLVR